MKTKNHHTMRFKKITASLLFFLMMSAGQLVAQPPLPSQHGDDGDQGAPIGGGIAILLTLAGAYGAKKVYDARRRIRE